MPDMIDLESRRAGSTIHGFKRHEPKSTARARRDTSEYKVSCLGPDAGASVKLNGSGSSSISAG